MIVRLQADIVNTKESELPVCDQPYRTNRRKVRREEIEVLRNSALLTVVTQVFMTNTKLH